MTGLQMFRTDEVAAQTVCLFDKLFDYCFEDSKNILMIKI